MYSVFFKKGFKTSTGWNLGKKTKSIHLLEPFTSMPITGTKNRERKEKSVNSSQNTV